MTGDRAKIKQITPPFDSIVQGDVLDVLRTWPDEFVQTVVTSPPYWGLRDYGVAGQLGLEDTPAEFVEKMVAIFREVRRVLRKDGTLWMNLGDSYNAYNGGSKPSKRPAISFNNRNAQKPPVERGFGLRFKGLKPKDLIGIPWRVALALQADGWFLRSDIIWSKPNPMPESVKDRPTKAHEYIFLMTKSDRYFYDADAIGERAKGYTDGKPVGGWAYGPGGHSALEFNVPDAVAVGGKWSAAEEQAGARRMAENTAKARNGGNCHDSPFGAMRNVRSVWDIATQPYKEAHFATFPEAIPTRCILAGTKRGQTVLDPFMGSGTVAVVSKRLNRPFLGIDLNPEYIEMAQRRLAQEPAPHPELPGIERK